MTTVKASILIALRNEERNIPALLKSIDKLSFPKDKLEILFGNDASEDATSALLHNFASSRSYARVIDLPAPLPHEPLKGKTRVLERLAREAQGNYFFFTDADVEVPSRWVEGMLSHFATENTGVVVGVTGMKPQSLKATMQSMEWLTVLYMLYWLSNRGVKGTGMGNNMTVSREAYLATGGYACIPFSIVEDYALFKAITDLGYGFRQAFDRDILAFTVPPDNFFEQRKRWLRGGFESKSGLILPGLLQSLWIPVLLLVYFLYKPAVPYLAAFSILILATLTFLWQKKLKLKGYLRYVPVFAVYLPLTWLLIQIHYFLPGGVKWKNRNYG